MDKVSDFFSELTARVRSPFFFSFVFSWTVYNWKVPLSIILYNKDDLKELGYKSHFDFIDQFWNWHSYIIPLCFAILYTALSPGIKAVSTIVQAWFKKMADKKVRDMHSTSWLPMSVFLRRQDAFQNQQAQLNDLLANEIQINIELQKKTNYNNDLMKENSGLKVSLATYKDDLSSVSNKLERAQILLGDRSSIDLMDGYWSISVQSKSNNGLLVERNFVAQFLNGNIAIVDAESAIFPHSLNLENVVILPENKVILVFSDSAFVPQIAKYNSPEMHNLIINHLITQIGSLKCTFTRTEFTNEIKKMLTGALRDD